MVRCSQCNRQAIGSVNGANLCVDHLAIFQQTIASQQAELAASINYHTARIEDIFGVSGGPRLEIPQPIIHQGGPVTMNNINIDRSVVGTINTGNVESLETSLSSIKQGGDEQLAATLKLMTEVIVNSKELKPAQKDEALEALAFVGEQSLQDEGERKTSLIRSAIEGQIPNAINLSASILTIWETCEPIIKAHLGIK